MNAPKLPTPSDYVQKKYCICLKHQFWLFTSIAFSFRLSPSHYNWSNYSVDVIAFHRWGKFYDACRYFIGGKIEGDIICTRVEENDTILMVHGLVDIMIHVFWHDDSCLLCWHWGKSLRILWYWEWIFYDTLLYVLHHSPQLTKYITNDFCYKDVRIKNDSILSDRHSNFRSYYWTPIPNGQGPISLLL